MVTLDVAPHTPDAASEFPESSSGKACLSLIEGRLGNVPQPTRTRMDLMNYADSEHVASIFHDALGCDFHGFDTLSPGKMSCGVRVGTPFKNTFAYMHMFASMQKRYVLHVDDDYDIDMLDRRWLEKAFSVMASQPSVSVVCFDAGSDGCANPKPSNTNGKVAESFANYGDDVYTFGGQNKDTKHMSMQAFLVDVSRFKAAWPLTNEDGDSIWDMHIETIIEDALLVKHTTPVFLHPRFGCKILKPLEASLPPS